MKFQMEILEEARDCTKSARIRRRQFIPKLLCTDEKYADTYQLSLLAGKFFYAKQGVYQPDEIVLNEEAAKSLGFLNPQDAIGQQIRMHSNPAPLTIGGVIKNFHFESMHKEIKPLAFLHIRNANIYRFLSFKIPAGNVSQSIRCH